MRRVAATFAATATLFASTGVAIAAEAPVETGARASILAAVLDAQPAFDPALVDSRSARSNIGRSSLNSVVWPSFLVDAFFFLYGFQSVERLALGVSEARSPQGPTSERATMSDIAFANGGDPDLVPGKAGRSESKATAISSSGIATITDAALPGGAEAGKAISRSEVGPAEDGTRAAAEQRVAGLVAGPLRVDGIVGRATVVHASAVTARASLAIVDASVAGVPVRIDEEGARAATAPLQEQVDAALADSGIGVRILPSVEEGGSSEGEASSGGLLVETHVVAEDPSGTPRDVKVGYVLGSARSTVAVGAAAGAPPSGGAGQAPGSSTVTTTPVLSGPIAGGPLPDAPSAGPLIRRRLVVTEPASQLSASARGAYGALMIAGLLLLFLRPLVRAGARP